MQSSSTAAAGAIKPVYMAKRILSADEIKAAADAASTARNVADVAKQALDADPSNQALKDAHQKAEEAAVSAKSKADALSQESGDDTDKQRKVQKLKRKQHFISKQLQDLGESEEDDDDDTEDDDDDLDEDPDKTVTFGDLRRLESKNATQSAKKMADAIEDPIAKAAVKQALDMVKPSGNPEQDFKNAIAIANREKNSKILEELGRKPVPVQHRSGAGAPAKQEDGKFEPTQEEARFMRAFNLTEKDIIAARLTQ